MLDNTEAKRLKKRKIMKKKRKNKSKFNKVPKLKKIRFVLELKGKRIRLYASKASQFNSNKRGLGALIK